MGKANKHLSLALNLIVEGSGPPIVFIHGFGLDHRMWEKQMNFFSSGYTVIALDLRGFGKSAPPSDQAFAYHEDIAEVLDFLQIDQPVVLMGHSMGARAVANFVLTYPKKQRASSLRTAPSKGTNSKISISPKFTRPEDHKVCSGPTKCGSGIRYSKAPEKMLPKRINCGKCFRTTPVGIIRIKPPLKTLRFLLMISWKISNRQHSSLRGNTTCRISRPLCKH
jgi:hypothetical protein